MDFYRIKERSSTNGSIEIYPDFIVCRSKDLMIRGKSFYAIWNEEKGLWSTDEYDVQKIVDQDLAEYKAKLEQNTDHPIRVKWMSEYSSNSWAQYIKYKSNVPDSSKQLDEKLTFANDKVKKTDYVSKRLPYSLEKKECPAYEELISTLYDLEERQKLEWAIGSIISGDSRNIQKFVVIHGEAGAGKSTVLGIVQKLFAGYCISFDAKALTSSSNAFSTEVFRSNPLVAIQHDGDLSRIEDNTKLNSIVSHEDMTMNEKYKASYTSKLNCFLFMGTNRPVKITDAKSGIIRRLIDVNPSGRKIPSKHYFDLLFQIDFELGAIAQHCLDVYLNLGRNYYEGYRPLSMIYQTDVFFNFVEAQYDIFKEQNGVSLQQAYEMYKSYCDESLVEFKLPKYKFREELKDYFEEFIDRGRIDGQQIRSYYSGFKSSKFEVRKPVKPEEPPNAITLSESVSLLDDILVDCPAQYANDSGVPSKRWDRVTTKLKDLDTSKPHYVKPQDSGLKMIVVDFDLRDESGNKSLEKNLEEASKWPPTYSEISQGGNGLHLHYIFDGDESKLNPIYKEGIEIKVFTGNSALRRRVSRCNNVPVATISSGLPIREEKKVVNFSSIKNENQLRNRIVRTLQKEYLPGTKPSIDFIKKLLDDAYESGMKYDVNDLYQKVLVFASNSTHYADYCMKKVTEMHFNSEEQSTQNENYESKELVFYDVEVFPNLFVVCWKIEGPENRVVKLINPSPSDMESLMKMRLVGFNCRRYDNHIVYARYIGYSNDDLFQLSQKIINGGSKHMFGEAYNLSYTDIYDFSSEKKSLKKFEIELGIHHQEVGIPWDQPVPEDQWDLVADYCANDVIATEAVFHNRKADWTARQILADIAGMSVNDTTNTLSGRIIFGNDRSPQGQFNYRNLGDPDVETHPGKLGDPEFTRFDSQERPIFPGYKFENGKSTYRDQDLGEGGEVFSECGMFWDVALLDIESMHPHSAIAENLFGKYTQRFEELLRIRLCIKHGRFEEAKKLLNGALAKYLEDTSLAEQLSFALKIVINSVYGLTSAKFQNLFKDNRNIDNIVAKRGALFMINLRHEVQDRGYIVAHIKTDSIKIPNADMPIIRFVQDYGKQYGYNFAHEATYDRMCLVNKAVYIANYATVERCCELYGEEYVQSEKDILKDNKKHPGSWTATGTQFQVPYVFKSLFSKEEIIFEDMCETKSVTGALYLDMNESAILSGDADAHEYHFVGKVGQFCPIKPGRGGGVLLRLQNEKYYAVSDTTGYRWLESEMVRELHKEDDIDESYYESLVQDAIKEINKYGDFESFVEGVRDDSPPWDEAIYDAPYEVCYDCPTLNPNSQPNLDCSALCKTKGM